MLEYRYREHQGIGIMDFKGEIDGSALSSFKEGLLKLLEKGHQNAVLNFSQVIFISSSGIGSIVSFYKQIKERNGQIVIFGMREVIRQVFEIVRLHKVIPFCETEEEALALFNKEEA